MLKTNRIMVYRIGNETKRLKLKELLTFDGTLNKILLKFTITKFFQIS